MQMMNRGVESSGSAGEAKSLQKEKTLDSKRTWQTQRVAHKFTLNLLKAFFCLLSSGHPSLTSFELPLYCEAGQFGLERRATNLFMSTIVDRCIERIESRVVQITGRLFS